MVISRASKGIVGWIYNNLDDEKRTRFDEGSTSIIELKKRLKVVFLYILVGLTLLIASNWIDKKELVLSVVFVAIIRLWNGGHHFEPDLCYLVTSAVIIGIPLINPYLSHINVYTYLWTLVITFAYAPFIKRGSENKNLIRKSGSIGLIIVSYAFNIELLSIALLVLSLDLIKYQRR